MKYPAHQATLFESETKPEAVPLAHRLSEIDTDRDSPAHDDLVAWLASAAGAEAILTRAGNIVHVPEKFDITLNDFRHSVRRGVEMGIAGGFIDAIIEEVSTFSVEFDHGRRDYEIIRQVLIEAKSGKVSLGPTLRQIKVYASSLHHATAHFNPHRTRRVIILPMLVHIQEIPDRYRDAFTNEGVVCVRVERGEEGYRLVGPQTTLPANIQYSNYVLGRHLLRSDTDIIPRRLWTGGRLGLLNGTSDPADFLAHVKRFGVVDDDPMPRERPTLSLADRFKPMQVIDAIYDLSSDETQRSLHEAKCGLDENHILLRFPMRMGFLRALANLVELSTITRILFGRAATLSLIPAEPSWTLLVENERPDTVSILRPKLRLMDAASPQLRAFLEPAAIRLQGRRLDIRYPSDKQFHHDQLNQRSGELADTVATTFGPEVEVTIDLED